MIEKLNGLYRGKVVKHLSHGKCKVFIPSVYDPEFESKPDMLPDAEQAAPLFAGSNNGNGVFSYPNIGTIVLCMFFNGDQNYPVFWAATLGGQAANSQYNEARPMPSQGDDDAYVHKLHVKNTDIQLYETGMVKVFVEKDGKFCKLNMDADGNITIDSATSITLKTKEFKVDSETQIDLKAPNVKVEAGINFTVLSPSINLDSTEGGTAIKTRQSITQF